uniref:Uncharacterized protein n=1 Tax=Podoviridae sp. ctlpi2 TaxID=2826574 RepID=A0A8S5MMI0_9CAUD|nr:MAG TPA: hypothetical protein [Podoviridae sp. ctlpi2]
MTGIKPALPYQRARQRTQGHGHKPVQSVPLHSLKPPMLAAWVSLTMSITKRSKT